MTPEELASVTLEHLRAIRATQADHGDELAAIRLELSAMGQQLAGLTTAVLDIADDTRKTAETTQLMLEHLDDALTLAKWLAGPAIEKRRAMND